MRRLILALAVIAGASLPAAAQEPRERLVVTYRAAPGEQQALLTLLARQDAARRAAGLPGLELYVHQEGAAWDYLVIADVPTPEQGRAYAAEAQRLGVTIGPRAGLEIRRYVAEHSDTRALGPISPADYLARVSE